MSEFINTIDVLGDEAVIDSIIQKTITEFKDNRVEKVGAYAFYGCTALETVELPKTETVWSGAFYGCVALETIGIPNVKTIFANAFNGCNALKKLTVPNATKLEGYLFQNTSPSALEEIVCPNVAVFGAQSILHTVVTSLDIHVVTEFGTTALPDTLGTLILRSGSGVSSLKYAISNCSPFIYVPAALVDSYKSASNWSALAENIRALEDYTVDGTTTGELDATKI